jgi:hypothetical protein
MTTIAYEQEAYLRHARRFGVECVLETAARGWPSMRAVYGSDAFSYDFGAALRSCDERLRAFRMFRVELDAIDAGRKVGLRGLGRPPRRRRSTAETLEVVRQLRAERLPISVIAEKLGVKDAYVKRCLKAENGAANPHGSAVDLHLNGKDGLAPVRAGSEQNRQLVLVGSEA